MHGGDSVEKGTFILKIKAFYYTIALAGALCVFATSAEAKVFSIPSQDAIATISIPDDWKPNETDNGIEMNSPDAGIYVDAEQVQGADIATAVTETVTLLTKQGLVIDESSKQQSDSEKNGLKMHDFLFKGKDKDGPTNFSITLIETATPDKFLMLTFWGSDEAVKANDKVLGEIAQSVQLTKQ